MEFRPRDPFPKPTEEVAPPPFLVQNLQETQSQLKEGPVGYVGRIGGAASPQVPRHHP